MGPRRGTSVCCQQQDGSAAGRTEGADGGERDIPQVDPGVECRAGVGADPDRPAGERDRSRAILIARDSDNLGKI